MKSQLLKFWCSMATISLFFISSQCSEQKSELIPTCSVVGTLKSNICGVGVWGKYVIVLDNGTVLQPYDAGQASVAAAIKNFVPTQDTKITFDYEVMQRDTRYDSIMICQAVPTYQKTTPIRFTCFQ